MDQLIQKALLAKRESKSVEFKQSFSGGSGGDWVEIIKDIVAVANSGGGVILFGVDDDSTPADEGGLGSFPVDPAVLVDKVSKYVGSQRVEFEIVPAHRDSAPVVALRVFGVSVPLVFESPGTYQLENGKQKTAFSKGTVYFRHGAKSEPGNSTDLGNFIAGRLAVERREFQKNVRRIAKAPLGSAVHVYQPGSGGTAEPTASVRLVDDSNAPSYGRLSPDVTHPYRRKELEVEVSSRLPSGVKFTAYDVNVIRAVHRIDGNKGFVYFPKFGSPQYSAAFADWIVQKVEEDRSFFSRARQVFRSGGRQIAAEAGGNSVQ